ncbi:MAG TPA: DUF255 domain-containing protein, partial [Cyclobacteriaceae bacterium]|nr:DUF255 domain-containing protein [Cyclobacteriaceae bacterium]
MSNRLIHATSPYLLQHAHNPVDWFEWGKEALDKAKKENKIILVSIGYSACHWCHVMERESFENEQIATIMNKHFVCIKVDREERPDIDHLYMDAVQAMGMHGGWPLNVFCTPDQKPFYGGTYFPPQTWTQVLQNIQHAYQHKNDEIIESAESLSTHLNQQGIGRFMQSSDAKSLTENLEKIYQELAKKFDHKWGGLDKAPKFIMPSIWQWLLRYCYISKNEEAIKHLKLTLSKIQMGGIYDHIAGGFARYSVDEKWFVPHFEKMLYDNAQLLSLYAEAYQLTAEENFKTVVHETFQWLVNEMMSSEGGFYSALDADSEGEEGKFYVWTANEITDILGADAASLIIQFYN